MDARSIESDLRLSIFLTKNLLQVRSFCSLVYVDLEKKNCLNDDSKVFLHLQLSLQKAAREEENIWLLLAKVKQQIDVLHPIDSALYLVLLNQTILEIKVMLST